MGNYRKFGLVVVLVFALLSSTFEAADRRAVSSGAPSSACNKARRILKGLSPEDVAGNGWTGQFGLSWIDGSYQIQRPGTNVPFTVEYQFQVLDIDNDGQDEVLYKEVWSLHFLDTDYIYVMPKSSFDSSVELGTFSPVIGATFKLNAQNSIRFSDGTDVVPSPGAWGFWKIDKINYFVIYDSVYSNLILKSKARSFVLGRIGNHLASVGLAYGGPRIVPTLICRITIMR